MKLNDYQSIATGFRSPTATWDYLHLNLAGECGELLGLLAKIIRDGYDNVRADKGADPRELAKKELGDILWHVAAIADDMGVGLEEVAQMNIDKLTLRKEKGKLGGSGDTRELDD